MTGDMTYAAVCWLRYQKNCDIVCTELGNHWLKDACGIYINREDGKPALEIEIEVKSSLSDLRRDFIEKKNKHGRYKQGERGTPNYMYYLVPTSMIDKTKEIIKGLNPSYGILEFNAEKFLDKKYPIWVGNCISSARKCKKLCEDRPFPSILYRAGRRLQNEYFAQKYLIRSQITQLEFDIENFGKQSAKSDYHVLDGVSDNPNSTSRCNDR